MSVIGSEDTASDARGEWDDDALRILEQLDADNEHYMLVNIELRDLLEEAVTREVGLEHRVDSVLAEVDALRAENSSLRSEVGDLRAQLDRVEAEIVALHNTKLMRAAAPFRSVYARLRRRRG